MVLFKLGFAYLLEAETFVAIHRLLLGDNAVLAPRDGSARGWSMHPFHSRPTVILFTASLPENSP